MENFSAHIGKKVIALSAANEIGYLLDLCFDEGFKFVGFVAVDSETENEMFLPFEKIVSAGEVVMVADETSFEPFIFDNNNPLSKQVYSDGGVDLGRVTGLTMAGKSVDKLITEKAELKTKNILSQSKNLIIIAKTKKNRKKTEKKTEKIINIPKIEIMSAQNGVPRQPEQEKLSMAPRMILNKRATQDIIGFNNELILKKDEIITEKSIEKAKKHNKLNYLIFNCK